MSRMRREQTVWALTALFSTVLLPAAWAGTVSEASVTPTGSSVAEAFAELDRRGLTVVVADGGRRLVMPGPLRGKPVTGKDLVAEVAKFYGLRTVWRADGAVAVLYPAAGDEAAPAINSAEAAWKAGWARDARAIPALVAAANGADPELAWRASRALQRMGWPATLALGGEAAWDWKVAAADCAAYRGTRSLDLKDPDYLAFLQAARGCGPIVGKQPLEFLGQAAGHWHKRVRGHAILAAARLPAGATSALLDKTMADRSREVRGCAAEAAGRLAAVAVLEKLLGDPSAAIRYRAVDALGAAGGDKAAALLEKASTDPDPVLRQHVLSALTAIGGDRAFRGILAVATNKDANLALRRHAISCLGAAGGEKALEPLGTLLAESDANLRCAAASALGGTGAKGLPLLARAVADPDEQVGMQAVASVGRIGGPEAVKLLEKALGDSDEYMRAAAAKALGEVGGGLSLPPLRKALADPDSLVRAAAATALGRSGTVEALALLEGALGDRDIGVRADTAVALASFSAGDDKVWSLLARLAADEDAYVCSKAVSAAATLGGPRSIEALKKAAGHSAGKVRLAAVAALGSAGGPAAVSTLQAFLADAAPEIRAAALEALGAIGGAAALGEVEKALAKKSDAAIRQAALSAAVRIGGEKALTMLEGAIGPLEMPPDPAVTAIGELGGIDGNRALAVLEKALARARQRHFHHDELEAMGRLRGAERARIVKHLEKFILSPDSDRGRTAAAKGLGWLGGEGCEDLLNKARELQDGITKEKGTYSPREEILKLLEAAGQVEAVDVLRKMVAWGLREGGLYVQTGQAALLELNDYSGEEDVPVIARILAAPHDPDGPGININYTAADSLGRIGGAKARDALLDGLRNPKINSRVRGSIAVALNDYFPGDAEARKAIAAAPTK